MENFGVCFSWELFPVQVGALSSFFLFLCFASNNFALILCFAAGEEVM